MRVVVLGPTGFVGSAILRRAPLHRAEVHALVRGDATRVPATVARVVPGELPDLPPDLFPDAPHVVLHFATKQRDDGAGFDVNERAATAIARALRPSCAGIVYGSSLSVYGQGEQRGDTETRALHPETPLATSRVRAEEILLGAARVRGIGAFALRPRFVVGEGDRSTLPALLALFRRGLLLGDGSQRFTIVDVDDYAEVALRLSALLLDGEREVTPLHVGYGRAVSLDEIRGALHTRFALPRVRAKIPVSPRVTRALSRVPAAGARALATRLELVGLSHYVSVDRLAEVAGADVVRKDPCLALARAAETLEASP
jgi:nucleoside-diphosphate-sugar epimerase